MKKYFWLVIILVIAAGYLIFNRSKTAEYAELSTDRPVRGNPEASVVLVEFSDFQCPACGAAQSVVKEVLDKYSDKIRFEYHHFPLTSIHRYAYRAAEAAECAGDQKKFWENQELLFENQNSLQPSDLEQYAEKVGLDAELWRDCLDTHAKKYAVEKDISQARIQGLNSTPTFLLNGQKVSDWRNLPQLVQALVEPLVPFQNSALAPENVQ